MIFIEERLDRDFLKDRLGYTLATKTPEYAGEHNGRAVRQVGLRFEKFEPFLNNVTRIFSLRKPGLYFSCKEEGYGGFDGSHVENSTIVTALPGEAEALYERIAGLTVGTSSSNLYAVVDGLWQRRESYVWSPDQFDAPTPETYNFWGDGVAEVAAHLMNEAKNAGEWVPRIIESASRGGMDTAGLIEARAPNGFVLTNLAKERIFAHFSPEGE
jgi:hypothetical protein